MNLLFNPTLPRTYWQQMLAKTLPRLETSARRLTIATEQEHVDPLMREILRDTYKANEDLADYYRRRMEEQ